jgi:hypothetical protein
MRPGGGGGGGATLRLIERLSIAEWHGLGLPVYRVNVISQIIFVPDFRLRSHGMQNTIVVSLIGVIGTYLQTTLLFCEITIFLIWIFPFMFMQPPFQHLWPMRMNLMVRNLFQIVNCVLKYIFSAHYNVCWSESSAKLTYLSKFKRVCQNRYLRLSHKQKVKLLQFT